MQKSRTLTTSNLRSKKIEDLKNGKGEKKFNAMMQIIVMKPNVCVAEE